MNLSFYWIDAFTSTAFAGNPCAVFLNADAFTDQQMQSLAKEVNLSETAFVFSSTKAHFRARYFTPDEELPFAGHPTVAVAHALLEAGLLSLQNGVCHIQLELPAGIIPLIIERIDGRTKVTMTQLKPHFLRTYDAEHIASIFGINASDFTEAVPVQTVSTGTPILMIPLKSHEALRRVHFKDFAAYKALKESGDFYFPHHFVLEGITSTAKTFARSLATPPSLNDDPFTGSATGCMGAYLWKYKLISEPRFVAEQGHWLGRPGEAFVEVVGPHDNIESVKLTGSASTVFAGPVRMGIVP